MSRLPRPLWIALATIVMVVVGAVGLTIHRHQMAIRASRNVMPDAGVEATTATGMPIDPEQAAIREIRAHGGEIAFRRTRRASPIVAVTFKPDEATYARRNRIFKYNPDWPEAADHPWVEGRTVDDSTLAWLLQLPNLRRLDLRFTNVGDEGMKHVGKLTELEQLDLYGTDISDASVPELIGLRRLKKLGLTDTGMTGEGVTAVLRALPQCEISWDLMPSSKIRTLRHD